MQITTTTNREPFQLGPELRHVIKLAQTEDKTDAQVLKALEFVQKFLRSVKETDIKTSQEEAKEEFGQE